MNLLKKIFSNKSGFTLIELLIVIAVIGVLAAVILVAIDPVEQLNRTRDAGVVSSVGQLGRAMQAYSTGQTTDSSFPDSSATYNVNGTAWTNSTWQTQLMNAGEIKSTITNPYSNAQWCTALSGTFNSAQSGFCYVHYSASSALIWAVVQSKSSFSKAGCTVGSQVPVAIWDGTLGRAGLGCASGSGSSPNYVASGAPAAGQNLK